MLISDWDLYVGDVAERLGREVAARTFDSDAASSGERCCAEGASYGAAARVRAFTK